MGVSASKFAFILLTDIYKSTLLWSRFPLEFRNVLEKHNEVIEDTVHGFDGNILKNMGDAYIALFDGAEECVSSGVELQREFSKVPIFPDGSHFKVRIVGHGGPLDSLETGKGYFGRPLNRASRICQVCHPGQVLISDKVKIFLESVPDAAELLDLGEHRLRDLAEPEHLFQLSHPEFAEINFPPLPSLGNRLNNLEEQPGVFIGREREIEEMTKLLTEDRHRLVTVTASGGYGKSRLAVQLVANILDEFPNGAFEIDLAPVGDTERIVPATADAIGFEFHPGGEPGDQLIDYLREKEMLIYFDNFEHLIEGRNFLSSLLKHAPGISILVTSREPLRIRGEKVFKISPLPVEPGVIGADNGGVSDAVLLFSDRASLVNQDFTLSKGNLPDVEAICSSLNGVPLSIELAAAWADSFTLSELIEEMENQLELTARLTDVPERHRSLRASLDWSYNLLSPEHRELLCSLSVFKGGFFFEGAKAVNRESGMRIRTLLSDLSDKSWLFTRDLSGRTRFFFRDDASWKYVASKAWGSESWNDAVLAHSRYFADLLKKQGQRLRTHAHKEASSALALEMENICEAIDTAVNRGLAELLLPFAKYLRTFLYTVSNWKAGVMHYRQIADIAREASDSELKSQAFIGLAWFLELLGMREEAARAAEDAMEAAREVDDDDAIAAALVVKGRLAFLRGEMESAAGFLEESLSMWQKVGDDQQIAALKTNLGMVAEVCGDYDSARAYQLKSLKIMRGIGDGYGMGTTLNNIGVIAYKTDDLERAKNFFEESLAIRTEIGDKSGVAQSLGNLASLAERVGDYIDALSLHTQSLAIKREIGSRPGIMQTLLSLEGVSRELGNPDDAAAHLGEALMLGREIGKSALIFAALISCGTLLAESGDYESAARVLFSVRSLMEAEDFTPDEDTASELQTGLEKSEKSLPWDKVERIRSEAEALSLDNLIRDAISAIQ